MPLDEREEPLNEVARRIMVTSNYDPHFSGFEDRLIMETKLFLARFDAATKLAMEKFEQLHPEQGEPAPIPMILFCPNCGLQHIDEPENHKPTCRINIDTKHPRCDCDRWTNPPHRSHKCHQCDHVWRPADVPTMGVADISTRGKNDSYPRRGVAG